MVYWLVVSTNPSEKWWSSSVGMIIPFPIWWESHNPAMFQSPPTSHGLSWWLGDPPFLIRKTSISQGAPKNARNATAGAMARAHLCSEHNLLKVSCQHLVRFEPRLIPKRTDWLWLAPYFCCGSAMTWIFLGKRSILAPVQSHLKPQRNTTWREQPVKTVGVAGPFARWIAANTSQPQCECMNVQPATGF